MEKEMVMDRIRQSGVVPVAVIDKLEHAVPLAKAMVAGGIDVIEVTLRTPTALDCIRSIARDCPEMLVGAGTVVTLDQCRQAVDSGANFIVSPGFNPKVVTWCVENGVAVVPGCVTPSEITAALELGLKVVKFFPSNIYGGLDAMRALAGPFPQVEFIPTSGIKADNIGQFLRASFICAAGGSWVCPRPDIEAGNFEKITQFCADTRRKVLGFEIVHIGMNYSSPQEAKEVAMDLSHAFGFPYLPGAGSSDFSSRFVELKKEGGRGTHGHIAIGTNCLPAAIAEMRRRGVEIDEDTWTYENGRLIAVYLKKEIGGFAYHLMRK